ncbi:MAG: methyltransferase domain-containing protein [Deltaproteobacteria bacterium]|jgi:SAM-dependent methyltransferase|nr:methyltransferase domain-containing protein [Deltaproteobacteria bacterium]
MNWFLILLGIAGILLIFLFLYVFSMIVVLPQTRGALFVTTSIPRIRALMDVLAMKPGQLFIDAGCGDGRVLREISIRFNVNAVGYELNAFAVLLARLRCLGMKNVRIFRKSFWQADFSKADVVFCYLFPDLMAEMADKIRNELKTGGIFVSCNFGVPGLAPSQVIRPAGSLNSDPIYIYRNEALRI